MSLDKYFSDIIFPEEIRIPIKSGRRKELNLPKPFFPYSEEYIEFALYEKLSEKSITAYLEPILEKLSGLPWGLSGHRINVNTKGVYIEEKLKMKERPDILLPPCVLEIENFNKSLSELTRHARKYEEEIGLPAFTVTWKTELILEEFYELKTHNQEEKLIFINPYDGKIENKSKLLETLKDTNPSAVAEQPVEEEKILIKYSLPGASDDHKRIQYEFAKWLWENNSNTAFEVPLTIKNRKYEACVPDLVRMSKIKGFIDWEPNIWVAPYIARRVDVVSFKNDVLSGFEIKSSKDLMSMRKTPTAIRRALIQLSVMLKSNIFNEAYIVFSYGTEESLTYSFKKSLADGFKGSEIGVILQTGPEKFEIIKSPKFNEKAEPSYYTIEIF